MRGDTSPRPNDNLSTRLATLLQRAHKARSARIDNLRLLTGGASRQTWSFEAVIEHGDGTSETLPLVLRIDPRKEVGLMSRETEFALLKAAHEEGMPVAKVHLIGDESLGAPGFLMERVEGETIARKLLRDPEYAEARQVMTGQLGGILARIHAVPIERYGLDALPTLLRGKSPAETEVDRFEDTTARSQPNRIQPSSWPSAGCASTRRRQPIRRSSTATTASGTSSSGRRESALSWTGSLRTSAT
jgi:aminoglycoside phosphotransferase (APT) family kinase protein